MTEDELIQQMFDALYAGCDPAVENNPRRYSMGFYRAGWIACSENRKIIHDKVQSDDEEAIQRKICDAHYAQGVAYSAYQASHCSLDFDELAGLTPSQAANAMREHIVETLRVAAMADKARAEAKA